MVPKKVPVTVTTVLPSVFNGPPDSADTDGAVYDTLAADADDDRPATDTTQCSAAPTPAAAWHTMVVWSTVTAQPVAVNPVPLTPYVALTTDCAPDAPKLLPDTRTDVPPCVSIVDPATTATSVMLGPANVTLLVVSRPTCWLTDTAHDVIVPP